MGYIKFPLELKGDFCDYQESNNSLNLFFKLLLPDILKRSTNIDRKCPLEVNI